MTELEGGVRYASPFFPKKIMHKHRFTIYRLILIAAFVAVLMMFQAFLSGD